MWNEYDDADSDGNQDYFEDFDYGCYSYLAEQVLPRRPQVDTIQSHCNMLNKRMLKSDADFADVEHKLKTLTLSHLGITDDLVQKLCKALETTTFNVEELDLSRNTIGKEGAQCIGQMLRKNRTLKNLILNENKIGDQGAKAIADSLANGTGGNATSSKLECLFLNSNKIGDKGMMFLCQSLTPSSKSNNSSNLTTFSVFSNKFGSKCTKYIRDMLITNKTLTMMCLSNNAIGDVGAKTIADGMKRNQNLVELQLMKCQMGDTGIAGIAKSMEVNTTLKTLYLCYNNISDRGAKALGDMLRLNKGPLATLSLEGNSGIITDVGYEALVAGWRDHYYLLEIAIDGMNAINSSYYDEDLIIQKLRFLYEEQKVLSTMNKHCHRSILLKDENDVPDGLWANILYHVGTTKNEKSDEIDPRTPTFMFQMLKHKPELVLPRSSRNNGSEKVQKHNDPLLLQRDSSSTVLMDDLSDSSLNTLNTPQQIHMGKVDKMQKFANKLLQKLRRHQKAQEY